MDTSCNHGYVDFLSPIDIVILSSFSPRISHVANTSCFAFLVCLFVCDSSQKFRRL